MDLTPVEQVILDRFYERSRMAGGPRTGYMLRRQAVLVLADDHPQLDLGAGLDALAEKGLLLRSESGDLYYLADSGVEALTARSA